MGNTEKKCTHPGCHFKNWEELRESHFVGAILSHRSYNSYVIEAPNICSSNICCALEVQGSAKARFVGCSQRRPGGGITQPWNQPFTKPCM